MVQFNSRFIWFMYGAVLLLTILTGICCYYAGYIAASKEFHSYYMAESLNDKISASLYTLYGDTDLDSDTATTSSDESSLEAEDEIGHSDDQSALSESPELVSESSRDQQELPELLGVSEASLYDAYLIGFGAKRSADRYVAKLMHEHIIARVIMRENINSRGKKIIWYQVILGPLPYNKLLEIVELLKYRDKLEGVVFVEHKA